ncbi:IBR finger domain protein [Aspergillus keveii]|uniref:IBR finger domain protein n=1 Tax=Aspergillus keveii TaxID=714993 RepID=A0ABR4FPA2_9EURO
MLPKRTVLITGCSDGSLGSHLALQFHAAGWRVFASARNMAKLKLAQEAVNNAGAGYSMPVSVMEISKARDLFELNVWSLIAVTQAFLPLLLASTHEDGALLINHGSLSGPPFSSFTDTMRLELEPFDIKVLNLVTGAVRSTFHVNAPRPQLAANSLYAVARETVERAMDNEHDEGDTDPSIWARRVVAQVSRRRPPYWVWAGKFSGLVWWGSLFPVGFFDRFMKRMVGLDVVERNVKAQRARGREGKSDSDGAGKI